MLTSFELEKHSSEKVTFELREITIVTGISIKNTKRFINSLLLYSDFKSIRKKVKTSLNQSKFIIHDIPKFKLKIGDKYYYSDNLVKLKNYSKYLPIYHIDTKRLKTSYSRYDNFKITYEEKDLEQVEEVEKVIQTITNNPHFKLLRDSTLLYVIDLLNHRKPKINNLSYLTEDVNYLLPIVIQCLIMKPNRTLIIENPEFYLHPSVQTKLSNFFCEIANKDVQLIIKTQSDHIINGMRVNVKNKIIKPDDIQVLFFDNVDFDLTTSITSIQIDEGGRIDNWIDGFMDEWDHNLMELL